MALFKYKAIDASGKYIQGSLDAFWRGACSQTAHHRRPGNGGLGGFTALMAAAEQGHARIVTLLLEAGAELDVRNKAGNTVNTRITVA